MPGDAVCVYIRASSHSQLHLTGGFRVGITTGRGLMLAHTWSVPQPWRALKDTLIVLACQGHTDTACVRVGFNKTHARDVAHVLAHGEVVKCGRAEAVKPVGIQAARVPSRGSAPCVCLLARMSCMLTHKCGGSDGKSLGLQKKVSISQ
jgi:hypothetical protein